MKWTANLIAKFSNAFTFKRFFVVNHSIIQTEPRLLDALKLNSLLNTWLLIKIHYPASDLNGLGSSVTIEVAAI